MPRRHRTAAALLTAVVLLAASPGAATAAPVDDLNSTAATVAADISRVVMAAGSPAMITGVLLQHGYENGSIGNLRVDTAIKKGKAAIVEGSTITLVRVAGTRTCYAAIVVDTATSTARATPAACPSTREVLTAVAAADMTALATAVTARAGAPATAASIHAAAALSKLAARKAPKGWGVKPATSKGANGSISYRSGTYTLKTTIRMATGAKRTCTVTVTHVPDQPATVTGPPACR